MNAAPGRLRNQGAARGLRSPVQHSERGREGGRNCHPVLAATPACSRSLPGGAGVVRGSGGGGLGSKWRVCIGCREGRGSEDSGEVPGGPGVTALPSHAALSATLPRGCAVLGEPHAARARGVDATLILTSGGRRERSRCRRPGPRPEAAGPSRAPASRHCSQVCVSSSVSNLPCFLLSRHWPLGRGPRGRLGVLPPSRGPLRHIYNEVPSQGWVGEDIRGPSTGPGTESGSRVSHRGRGVEVLHRHVVTKAGGW